MRPWCWERAKAGEGDGRGQDGWMASPTQWTWVWASSGSWWWTGKPGVLQSMGSQRVGHDWATELTDWGPITHCMTEWRSEQAAVSAADLVMGMGRLAIFPFCLFVLCYAMLLLLLSHFSRVRLCVTPSPDSPGNNSGVGCHFLLQCIKVKSESEITQSCLTLLHPMDCSLPGSSIHGIFQARVLEWDAIAFSSAMQ